ncbi:MAG: ATP-binding protein [Gammaproteobacteria bacterium]|nr:ATP-binding protein [Gammaproteobacteria bacterium]
MSGKKIRDKTLGEIRTFLDEVLNGTSRYRSLHNVTEQVTHQYHGRFLIELIQNAYDALFGAGDMDTPQRVEIVLAEDEQPEGALYVVNDGRPFTLSNFQALSNFAQSDKDPQKSIGNKGIGFRSVLEITNAPEIYSRNNRESISFDGYCFAFRPDVIKMFEELINRVAEGDMTVEPPNVFGGGKLLEWDDARFDNFRQKCRSFESDWIRKELLFLSPYALPVPLDMEQATPRVADFEKRGFSTVVRLPFLSERAKKIATEKLEEINENTIIFLHRVDNFRLTAKGYDKCYKREQIPLGDDLEEGFEVKINSDKSEDNEAQDCYRLYWLWKRTVGGERKPSQRDEIQSAVTGLHHKWKEVDEATVEIAVQIGNEPDDGKLNIFLPTRLSSGCAAHFSAPFYGDMSRTSIDFQNPLNSLLLRTIAEKGVDVILKCLPAKGGVGASAIIDILAPTDCDAGSLWWKTLGKVFADREIEIKKQDIALSDEGWRSLVCTRLLPNHDSNIVINAHLLRSEATYPVFVQTLKERENAIRRIFKKIDIDPEALMEDKAATVEAIARKLHESQKLVDWSGFWKDVESQFEDAEPLKGKKIILGTDSQLHSCGAQCSVFFRPRRDGQDSEVSGNLRIEDIPEKLSPFIAFLHKDIKTHISGNTTSTHNYLSKGLVEAYGVEKIFSSVLVRAAPELPHDIDGPKSQLCLDILTWAMRLLQASNHIMEEPIRLLKRLPAPCIGGWYPISETSFGHGWPEKSGGKLETYLRNVASPESDTALKKVLLPPDHSLWNGIGGSSADLLERAGTFNGIRLVPVTSKDWDAKFSMSYWTGVELPEKGPSVYSSDIWKAYREYIKDTESLSHSGEFDYEIRNLYALPGLEKIGGFDDANHKLLMDLLLVSITSWEKYSEWKKIKIHKINGHRHIYSPISPLIFSLRDEKWMIGEIDEEMIQFRPSDRWHIPSPAGGLHQFSHLKPIPASVASVLKGNPELTASMNELGMPSYDPEEKTADPRLLNDLAVALKDPTIDISNLSVFLGQVRTAWQQFYPDQKNVFPDSVIVQNGPEPMKVLTPSEEEVVYLPDAISAVYRGLELHSKPVVAMYPKDAKRLQDHFQNAYGNGLCLASELTTIVLVDGSQWQAQENTPQLFEKLSWLITVVLSIFAFSGGQSRGIVTTTFRKAIDALRRARIVWVDTLEAELRHGGASVARTPVPALWLPNENTLIARSDARIKVSKLSEALASIVDRADIYITLKLVLRDYDDAEDEISKDDICASLRQLHITEDHFQEVEQCWLGDIAWKVHLVRPLILLMDPEADIAPLYEVFTEEKFRDTLQSYSIAPLGLDDILSIVREATVLKSVGYKAWKILGNQAQLDQWNKVLSQLRESLVFNDQANAQFQEHMNSCRTIIRSIIRHTIRKHPESRGFNDFDAELSSLECPIEYNKIFWVVAFPEVMKKVRNILVEWDTDSDVISLVESTASAEELRDQLDELGLEPDLDPIEINADNRKIFFQVLEDVRECALAWCIREKSDVGIWEQDKDTFESLLKDDFARAAFIDIWNQGKCLQLIGKLNRPRIHEGFWAALNKSSTVSELKRRLEITGTDLDGVHDQLEARKQKCKRKQ